MARCVSILLALALVALCANSALGESNAVSGFEKLKSLAGEWKGRSSEGNDVSVSYQVVSGGSALMETLTPANEPGMVTMYHLDGDKLMMTHYCSIGNQPRMRAEAPSGDVNNLSFTFFDATNLAKTSDGHMQGLTITFADADHLTQVWTYRDNGKDTAATFSLERKK